MVSIFGHIDGSKVHFQPHAALHASPVNLDRVIVHYWLDYTATTTDFKE